MNYCWVIPTKGNPYGRDVLLSDAKELAHNGYTAYTLELVPETGDTTRHTVFAQNLPTSEQTFVAAHSLFGRRSGVIRLLNPDGSLVIGAD